MPLKKKKHPEGQSSQQLPDEALRFVTRSLSIGGKQTTISLEEFYWDAIQGIARSGRRPWREIVIGALSCKPAHYQSRAGWLRLYVAGFAHAFLPRPLKREVGDMYLKSWWWARLLREESYELFFKAMRRPQGPRR